MLQYRNGEYMGGLRNKKYRITIFICFFITAIVPLLILGIYSYHSAKEAVRKNVRQANEAALIQIENKVDNILDGVRQNFFRLAVSNQTEHLISQQMDAIDYKELRNYIEVIGQNQAHIGYVSDYTLVNFENQWVLSNKGMYRMDEIENKDEVDVFRNRTDKIFWLNHTEKVNHDGSLREYVDSSYIAFVVKVPIYTQTDQAALIINLDKIAFERLLNQSLSNSSLTIFDDQGKLVFTENSDIAAYYADGLIEESEEAVTIGSTRYDIAKRKSNSSSWTFIAGYNPADINQELNSILITMGGIIFIILVLVSGISFFGMEKVYRPVKNLVSSFDGMMDDTEENDEFGLIHHGISQLVGNNERLQDLMERQKNPLKELFGLRLIRGTLNEQEIIQTRERLQTLKEPWFCVISALFCPNAENDLKALMEQDVLNLEMMNAMPDEIKDILIFPPFIYTRAIVMMLESSTKEEMGKKIVALRNCMSVYVTNSCSGYVDMGVSRLFEEVAGFKKAYQESLEALKINQYYGHEEAEGGLSMEESSITYYADLIRKNNSATEYNMAADTAVRDAVDHCQKEAAFKAVDWFMRDLSQNGAVMYEQHFYLHRFLMTILSVPINAGISVRDMFPEGESNLFSRFNQLYDKNSIRKFYEQQVILPVISHLEQFRKSSSEMLLEKIIDLIHQCGGDITLAECAERLGYHPSYIWRIMKNTRGITFTDYLAEQKIEMAKEMLSQTTLSVTEIAEKLNYSNAQNFIRLFKKHMDITPGQYRKDVRDNRSQKK